MSVFIPEHFSDLSLEVKSEEIPADVSMTDPAVEGSIDTETVEDKMESKEEGGNTTQKSLTAEGKQMCSTNLATKIHIQIIHVIIPQLHKVLTQKVGVAQLN